MARMIVMVTRGHPASHRVGVGAADPVVPLAQRRLSTNPTLSYSAIAGALSVRTSRKTVPPPAKSSSSSSMRRPTPRPW